MTQTLNRIVDDVHSHEQMVIKVNLQVGSPAHPRRQLSSFTFLVTQFLILLVSMNQAD